METRSKTFIVEDNKQVETEDYSNCIAMYRQMNGYPEGHGLDLAKFLQPFTIVNGISLEETREIANGLDCLAAQMVAHFKTGAGGIYLGANSDVSGLNYYYVIYENEGLKMQCFDTYDDIALFDGTPEQFIKWVADAE